MQTTTAREHETKYRAKTTRSRKRSRLRLVPRQWPPHYRFPGMDCQEVFHAKCDEHFAWLVAAGMHPNTPWVEIIRLVKGNSITPRPVKADLVDYPTRDE